MAYTKYSLTPADNNAAPPNGAPEGMLPSAVNDTMRDMMAQIRDVGDGIRGGTYTMTAPVITGGSITGVALSGNTLTNPVITGGSINNTPIGATTANTGAFTAATLKGSTSGEITLNTPAIAGTNTATFPAATGIVMVSGNQPAFSVYQSSAQTLSTNTNTKLLFQTEEFDTNSNFASSTFTPTVAGYYQVSASARMASVTGTLRMMIWKNGSSYKIGTDTTTANNGIVSTLVYCNGTTDYIEAYALINPGQALADGINTTWFNGCLVRAV